MNLKYPNHPQGATPSISAIKLERRKFPSLAVRRWARKDGKYVQHCQSNRLEVVHNLTESYILSCSDDDLLRDDSVGISAFPADKVSCPYRCTRLECLK